MLLFELCREVHPDRAFSPMGEGSMGLFPRAAILLPHLEYRRILFRCPIEHALSEAAPLRNASWNVR